MPGPLRHWLKGWRALSLFWLGVATLGGIAALVLAVLGSPPNPASPSTPVRSAMGPSNNAPWPGPNRAQAGAPIAPPDPLLLEPAPDFPGASLPRIGPSGRRASSIYAAFHNPAESRPRVALIVAGLGLNSTDSFAAIAQLPPAIDFAVSPYTADPARLLAAARSAGHEFMLSLPMEPANYPDNDEGAHQLLTGATPPENARNLEWALSRFTGYVGVTSASDGQRGERFVASPALMASVREELDHRGLLYLDARPPSDAPDRTGTRGVDLVVDDDPDAAEIDLRLIHLEQRAREYSEAIGLVGRPSPVTLARVAAWSGRLNADGIALVPVSSVLPGN